FSALAGSFSNDFNNGLPANTAVFGNAVVETTGGAGNSGVLKLTKSINSQSSSFIIEDFDAGAPIYGFDLSCKVRVGGGGPTPADGFSINFASDLPDGTFGEDGAGSGITFAFDIYDNGNEFDLQRHGHFYEFVSYGISGN